MKTAFLKTEIKMCQKNAFSHSFQKKQKTKKHYREKKKHEEEEEGILI